MKPLLILFAIAFTLTAHSQRSGEGYHDVPTDFITGDFNGDGKQDTFSQFVADSFGKTVSHLPRFGNWEDAVMFYAQSGYRNTYTFNNERISMPSQDPEGTIGLMWLFNVGNINNTPGDEIALVPQSDHGLDLNTCYIYSLCSGQWAQVYRFNISENAFTYPYGETEFAPYRNIPGFLEYTNGQWVHVDYMDIWDKPDDFIPTLHPLIVDNCK
ncbi:MAG: hypothetical protein V4581_17810 [Bacteroidota bacterium]